VEKWVLESSPEKERKERIGERCINISGMPLESKWLKEEKANT